MSTFVKYSGLTRVHSLNEYLVLTRVLFKLSVLSTYSSTDPQYSLQAWQTYLSHFRRKQTLVSCSWWIGEAILMNTNNIKLPLILMHLWMLRDVWWITSRVCISIFCDIPLEHRCHKGHCLWLIDVVVLWCWRSFSLVQNVVPLTITVKECIRMGITVFQIFIWGGLSSVILLETTFYGSSDASPYNEISNHITDDIPPQMKILNSYPLNCYQIASSVSLTVIDMTLRINIWAASWQTKQNDCAQWRLRSAWASAQYEQTLRCALNG